ncbi:hypothetical protein BGZ63DRAFT_44764 [Mariannaea sp. PMI_226]|nr:hypothetical protein BGZ63DRAFT_44764 [Mariannaea sp. PMI_226]
MPPNLSSPLFLRTWPVSPDKPTSHKALKIIGAFYPQVALDFQITKKKTHGSLLVFPALCCVYAVQVTTHIRFWLHTINQDFIHFPLTPACVAPHLSSGFPRGHTRLPGSRMPCRWVYALASMPPVVSYSCLRNLQSALTVSLYLLISANFQVLHTLLPHPFVDSNLILTDSAMNLLGC